ncbi:DYW family of nucleic acid deaminases-domain-containing protein [Coniochaeta sp. 2T2.1]|nr:DYW family of nucleic acid deaminases-domain-containing protein [Coniochaeta sp. 2T2.1]
MASRDTNQITGSGDHTAMILGFSRGIFVTAGTDLSKHFPGERVDDLVDECEKEANSRRKWTEATATTIVFEDVVMDTVKYVVSRMIQGDFNCVRQHLETSAEVDLFLNGVEAYTFRFKSTYPEDYDDDEKDKDGFITHHTVTGRTALHLASCEMYPKIVELLLERGADPNARDVNGRAPLSEAALWGRLENVKILIKHGANPLLACLRGGKRALAVDFARNDEVNAKQRSHAVLYKEDVYERNLDRRALVNLLESQSGTTGTATQQRPTLAGFAFTRAATPGSFLTLVAHFDVPNVWKTVGVLCRGSDFPPVAAMSGWGHHEDPASNIQVAGEEWTDAVRQICSYIGHNLTPHMCDQGQTGRYNACHAEKQLIAYFVSRHVFLEHDTREGWGKSVMGERDHRLHKLGIDCASVQEASGRLRETPVPPVVDSDLAELQPPVSLRKGVVMVSSPQCLDCQRFVERLNEILGLEITVVTCRVV